MILKISAWGLGFLGCVAFFFIWLFFKGYKAYKKNGWNDPFFNNDGIDGGMGGF